MKAEGSAPRVGEDGVRDVADSLFFASESVPRADRLTSSSVAHTMKLSMSERSESNVGEFVNGHGQCKD